VVKTRRRHAVQSGLQIAELLLCRLFHTDSVVVAALVDVYNGTCSSTWCCEKARPQRCWERDAFVSSLADVFFSVACLKCTAS